MDDIELPVPQCTIDGTELYSASDLRAAVIADRKRRTKPEPEPKPAHQATVYLGDDGFTWIYDAKETVARPIIRWTNDGRVWIESADHRRSASDLRRAALWLRSQDAHGFAATCARAADLLDGGEPC